MAIEQLFPQKERLISDDLAFPILPPSLKLLILLLRIKPIRNAMLNLIDRKVPGIRGGLLCRKRYINDKLIESINADIDSIVILGSGFDTIAYRIPELLSLQVFELDFPQNVAEKIKHIKRLFGNIPNHVRFIPIDFNSQGIYELLQNAGYSLNHRTFFIIEGVTQYITEIAFRKILTFLAKAISESKLAFTYIQKDFIEGTNMYNLDNLFKQVRINSKTWKLGFEPDRIDMILEEYNWNKIEDIGNSEYIERFIKTTGREIPVMEIERAVFASKK